MSDFNSYDFRICLGNFATGVAIVTTKSSDRALHGITINSFTSVSLEPPLVLFCLEKSAHSYEYFINSEFFAINILEESQQQISRDFSHPSTTNWEDLVFEEQKTGAPILNGILAYIECLIEKVYDGGDHSIFIGRVINLKKLSDKEPLLYFRGQYNKIGKML